MTENNNHAVQCCMQTAYMILAYISIHDAHLLAELKLTQHDLYPDVLMDRILKQTQIHHGVMDSLMHGHVGGPANKNLQ